MRKLIPICLILSSAICTGLASGIASADKSMDPDYEGGVLVFVLFGSKEAVNAFEEAYDNCKNDPTKCKGAEAIKSCKWVKNPPRSYLKQPRNLLDPKSEGHAITASYVCSSDKDALAIFTQFDSLYLDASTSIKAGGGSAGDVEFGELSIFASHICITTTCVGVPGRYWLDQPCVRC